MIKWWWFDEEMFAMLAYGQFSIYYRLPSTERQQMENSLINFVISLGNLFL